MNRVVSVGRYVQRRVDTMYNASSTTPYCSGGCLTWVAAGGIVSHMRQLNHMWVFRMTQRNSNTLTKGPSFTTDHVSLFTYSTQFLVDAGYLWKMLCLDLMRGTQRNRAREALREAHVNSELNDRKCRDRIQLAARVVAHNAEVSWREADDAIRAAKDDSRTAMRAASREHLADTHKDHEALVRMNSRKLHLRHPQGEGETTAPAHYSVRVTAVAVDTPNGYGEPEGEININANTERQKERPNSVEPGTMANQEVHVNLQPERSTVTARSENERDADNSHRSCICSTNDGPQMSSHILPVRSHRVTPPTWSGSVAGTTQVSSVTHGSTLPPHHGEGSTRYSQGPKDRSYVSSMASTTDTVSPPNCFSDPIMRDTFGIYLTPPTH